MLLIAPPRPPPAPDPPAVPCPPVVPDKHWELLVPLTPGAPLPPDPVAFAVNTHPLKVKYPEFSIPPPHSTKPADWPGAVPETPFAVRPSRMVRPAMLTVMLPLEGEMRNTL